MTPRHTAAKSAVCVLAIAGLANAQRGSGDWMTSASDAQRSSWVRNDAKISPESMAKPGFDLVWKLKFDNQARQLNTITPPSLIDFYIGYRGFRALGFFGASDGKVIAVDTEIARLEWTNQYPAATASAGTPDCPGGITAAVTRPTGTSYPPPPMGRGAGRGDPAKSGVGAPHEGSVQLAAVASRPAPPPRPKPAKPASKAAEAEPNPYGPHVQYALALAGDGKLHSLWISNGHEPKPPVQFVPPDAHAVGLIAYDGAAYVATTGSCGAAGNGIWSLDLATSQVNHWKSAKEVAGTAGPAVGPDGTLYATAGADLVALSPRKLETLAVHKADSDFTSTPVVFDFKGKNLIAATTNDGRLHVLDTAALNVETPLARSESFSSPYAAGALASWRDPAGVRWILAPSNNAIVAWKLVDNSGTLALERGWTSRNMTSPLPPIVVSGVVFAVSSGEFRSTDPNVTADQRAQKSQNAVLYALDAVTGKELWNSGKTITSFVHSGGLAAGGTRVYVATYEGTQYAFGFPIEH